MRNPIAQLATSIPAQRPQDAFFGSVGSETQLCNKPHKRRTTVARVRVSTAKMFEEALKWDGGWIRAFSEDVWECYDGEYDLICECTCLARLMRQLWRLGRVNKRTDFHVRGLLERIVSHYRCVDQYRGHTWEELFNDTDEFGIESKKLAKETRMFRKKMQALLQ
jgi:hypothetical protein